MRRSEYAAQKSQAPCSGARNQRPALGRVDSQGQPGTTAPSERVENAIQRRATARVAFPQFFAHFLQFRARFPSLMSEDMIARLIQLNPEVAKPQQTKMGLSETILSLEAILFWTVALPAASLVLSAALLREKIKALRSRQ
jgi:hypothetical protein